MEKQLPQLIKEIMEHHKDILWTNNVKNATDIEDFEKWCDILAQMHSVVTLKYLFSEEEFAKLQDESTESQSN